MQLTRPRTRAARHTVRELIDLGAGATMVCREFTLPFFPFRWHHHPEIELTLILAGRGTRHVGDAIGDFAPGDVCLIGSETPHTWHSPPGAPVRSLVVQFPAMPLVQAGAGLPELRGLASLFARCRRGLCLQRRLRADTAAAMTALAAERSPLRRLSSLIDILARIDSSRDALPLASVAWQPPGSTRDRALERLLAFVLEHRAQPLPHARVAQVAGVSPAGFSRWFHHRFGRTWRAFLMEVRVADACRLLADSDRTITDIALACGFANLSNFNRRFRQVKSASPSAYRRAARGNDL